MRTLAAITLSVLIATLFTTCGIFDSDETPIRTWDVTLRDQFTYVSALAETDGAYLVVGKDSEDFLWHGFCMSIARDGSVRWKQKLDSPTWLWSSSVVTTRNGIIIGGAVDTDDYYSRAASLTFLSLDGQPQREVVFGAEDGLAVEDICLLADGSGVATGSNGGIDPGEYLYSDVDEYLTRFDAEGNILWTRTYGFKGWGQALRVMARPGGGFAIIGEHWAGEPGWLGHLLTTTANGVMENRYAYDEGNFDDAVMLTDGDILVIGNNHDAGTAFAIRIDPMDGRRIWSRDYHTLGRVNAVASTRDGGFVMSGTEDSSTGKRSLKFARLASDGSVLWVREIAEEDDDVYSRRILATSDGGYLIAADRRDEPVIVYKTDADGNPYTD